MAEVKGKFITSACSLLEFRPAAKVEAMQRIKSLTGKEWDQLEPEGWYDTKALSAVFQAIEKHQGKLMSWAAIKIIGRRVFPTIEKTSGLPTHLKTPLDLIKWEGDSFLDNTRGTGVVPRKYLKTEPGHVVVEALSPGYNCILVEGVFEGILELCKIKDYVVKQTRCVKKGDPVCEYDIQWKE
jgi:hypothetical protein